MAGGFTVSSDGIPIYTETESIKTDPSPVTSEDTFFNRDRTLVLIDLFKKYKPSMTKGDIKTMKEMWEIIATDISNQFGAPVTGSKCQNRFKVLDRGYKKMMYDKEAGKRRKKVFPYAKEFRDIKPRKYEFVPGLVPPYNNVPNNNVKNDSSSTESATESAPEITYTEAVYISEEGYAQQTTPIDVHQTEYVNTTTEVIGAAEITVQTSASEQKQAETQWSDDNYFNRDRTLVLINLFKEFAPQVAMGAIKTKKEMWELIAKHMSEQFNLTIVGTKCENRFKVLERNFKNVEIFNTCSENEHLPPKKYEFEEELREIFGDKFKNRAAPPKKEKVVPTTSNEPSTADINYAPFTIRVLEAQTIPVELPVQDKLERILVGIRSDFQYYQNERLKVEWRKLAVEEENLKINKRKLKLLEDQQRTGS